MWGLLQTKAVGCSSDRLCAVKPRRRGSFELVWMQQPSVRGNQKQPENCENFAERTWPCKQALLQSVCDMKANLTSILPKCTQCSPLLKLTGSRSLQHCALWVFIITALLLSLHCAPCLSRCSLTNSLQLSLFLNNKHVIQVDF